MKKIKLLILVLYIFLSNYKLLLFLFINFIFESKCLIYYFLVKRKKKIEHLYPTII